ncbi:hypothetical protein ES288_A09G042200v1 [Gossypium darwinii]|uniref:Uncharacterized protein n=1 Tax=Gossypium darwinii TaxID=34276 RepID=A0A5D2F9J3_GOSDA|nr:hypothetical protein ES288_A09G042200v1 [Gossypium darwinii]
MTQQILKPNSINPGPKSSPNPKKPKKEKYSSSQAPDASGTCQNSARELGFTSGFLAQFRSSVLLPVSPYGHCSIPAKECTRRSSNRMYSQMTEGKCIFIFHLFCKFGL